MNETQWLHEAKSALLFSRKPGVGAATFRQWLEEWQWPSLALEAWSTRKHKTFRHKASLHSEINRTFEWLQQDSKSTFLTWYNGPYYPQSLAELTEPPPVLFIKGQHEHLQRNLIAIVGTRQSNECSEQIAIEIAKLCIDAGFVIVSGGAKGIDAIAHRQAIARQAPTIAVLGTGVDVAYPSIHKTLFQEISTHGILLSELFPGTQARASFFPTRNRILAALVSAVIVVHARPKSGSLGTAHWAAKLQRPLAWMYQETMPTTGVTLTNYDQAYRWLTQLQSHTPHLHTIR